MQLGVNLSLTRAGVLMVVYVLATPQGDPIVTPEGDYIILSKVNPNG